MTNKTVDIRPGVSVLAVLRHLNYKPWYALGEFVDNSVQSYLRYRDELCAVEGDDFKLRVSIDIDSSAPARISIRDNAAGIRESEYERAFRPAAIPPDRTGLAEFGMGMKSAACWFAPRWMVRTSALEEPIARSVNFDIENIVDDNIQELSIEEVEEAADTHFTEVVLEEIFHVPAGRTVPKLKEHLTDIYREFIRSGVLELRFNGEALEYNEPAVLNAPDFKNKAGPVKEWRKPIEFDLGGGLRVHGFAAIRETGNTAKAGFSLFRRGRVIQGSGDDGYRPSFIFGSSNSYRFQRLFGELHLFGFEVSHTKDGFRWDENEQPFLELLREHLDSDELPLLKQAEGYRVREPRAKIVKAAETAVNNTAEAMEAHLPGVMPGVADAPPVEPNPEGPAEAPRIANRRFQIRFRDRDWLINVELTDDPAESQWLALQDSGDVGADLRTINIQVSMCHPFMVRFAQTDSEDVEALLRVAASISLAEVLARDAGVKQAGTVRRNVNEIMASALSEP